MRKSGGQQSRIGTFAPRERKGPGDGRIRKWYLYPAIAILAAVLLVALLCRKCGNRDEAGIGDKNKAYLTDIQAGDGPDKVPERRSLHSRPVFDDRSGHEKEGIVQKEKEKEIPREEEKEPDFGTKIETIPPVEYY